MSFRQLFAKMTGFLGRRNAAESDLEDEMRAHVELETRENVAAGMPAGEARRAAMLKFGNATLAAEDSRAAWRFASLDSLLQDLRYGARMLTKSPGFTTAVVLTLALGIGANTAIFSVVRSVLLKALPYPEPERLVVLDEFHVRNGPQSVSWMDFLDWREQTGEFEALAAYCQAPFSLTGRGEPMLLSAGEVSAPFFSLLGAKPLLGRTFTPDEDRAGAARTTVLGYELWRDRFDSNPAVIGQTVVLSGAAYTVVGVMPPGFKFFLRYTDLYVPVGLQGDNPDWLIRGNHVGIRILARLKRGATFSSARSEMDALMLRLEKQYAVTNSGVRASATPLYDARLGDIRPALLTLLMAVACVLLIACANVANLQLARSAARQKEFAIRTALGAGRTRVLRQLLTESVLLSFLGGALGLLLAYEMSGPLLRLAPPDIFRLDETRLDGGVLLFTFVVAALAGILFGLAPAWQATRGDLDGALKESRRSATPGRSAQRLRAGLFVVEVALAMVMVLASGLLVRSFLGAQAVDPGFASDRLLTVEIDPLESKYAGQEQWRQFFLQALERIRALPGVESASAVFCPPVVGSCWGSIYEVSDRPIPPRAEIPRSLFNVAFPGYFRMMGVRQIEGREFTEDDIKNSPPVIVINQSLARRWWPGQSALGKRIKQGFPEDDSPYREIVGVVADLKQEGLDAAQMPEVFLSVNQHPADNMVLMVRTEAEPMVLAAAAVKEIHAIDKDLPVARVQPMSQYLAESLARRKFTTLLLTAFGALALALAAVGVYGVMAYGVAQRTHEFGLRMALGAQKRQVLRLVLGHGLRLVLCGVAIGLAASSVLTRLMASQLFGVTPHDPLTFASVSLLLAGVALLACYLPARRAMRVEPMTALRYE
jgi:putative ABC transport system permease protein